MTVSAWATSSSQLVRGRPASDPLPRVASGQLLFEDGSTAEVGDDLIELLRVLLGSGLAGRRARVEVAPELVTPDEAAELLEVSRPTVYTWQKSGVLGLVQRGNRRMVPMADIDAVREAAVGRERSDRLAEEARTAGPVLEELDYREALHAARRAGGEPAVAVVRRAQRAAQIRAAADQAACVLQSSDAG